MKTRVMVTIILLQLSATISTENTAERIQSAVMESWKIFSRPDEENGEKQTDEMPLLTNLTGAKESETLNALVDSIIAVGVTQVDSKLPIPDLDEIYNKKIGFVRVHASFKAEQGHLVDLKTLKRTGNTGISKQNDTWTLQMVLGFGKLSAFYEKYTAKAMGIKMSGSLKGHVQGNSFLLMMDLKKNSSVCKLRLKSFQLVKFDHIQIEMSGANQLMNWLRSKISTWIVKSFNEEIKKMLQARISSVIGKIFQHFEPVICKLF